MNYQLLHEKGIIKNDPLSTHKQRFPSHQRFHKNLISQLQFPNTDVFLFVKAETQHISLIQMIIIQIIPKLLLTPCMVGITTPYFEFDYILSAMIIDNHIRTFLVPGS